MEERTHIHERAGMAQIGGWTKRETVESVKSADGSTNQNRHPILMLHWFVHHDFGR